MLRADPETTMLRVTVHAGTTITETMLRTVSSGARATTISLPEISLIRAQEADLPMHLRKKTQVAETTREEESVRKRIRETRRILLTSRKR